MQPRKEGCKTVGTRANGYVYSNIYVIPPSQTTNIYIISAFIWEIHGLNVRIYAPVHSQGNNSCKPQRPSPREGVMDLFDKQKGNQTVLV